jgi:hypothetical protein
MMSDLILRPRTLGFTVATRVALGIGVGLLISERLDDAPRRRLGAALLALGAITTVPVAMALRRSRRPTTSKRYGRPGVARRLAFERALEERRSLG